MQRLGREDSHVGVIQGLADPCDCCVRGEYRVEVGEVGRDSVRALQVLVRRRFCSFCESNGLNPSFSTHCLEVPILSLIGNL